MEENVITITVYEQDGTKVSESKIDINNLEIEDLKQKHHDIT